MNSGRKSPNTKGLLILIAIFTMAFAYRQANAQTTIISNPYSSTISTTNTASIASSPIISNCLDLSYDLYQGLSDKANDKAVTNLQKFLKNNQYLSATPNGYFGPSTKSAVKAFQSKNNISSTGRVGPATRQVIRNMSCQANTNSASVIEAVATPKPDRVNASNMTVTNPSTGMVLRSENRTQVEWKNIPNAIYDIKLEDKNGLSYGFVANSVSGNSYNWEIGKVFSARTNSEIFVEPGSYRLALTSSNYRQDIPDQYSGLFSVLGRPLEIDSITPGSVSNSKDNSLVLYGRGFDSTTLVYYFNDNINRTIRPEFISTDGTIAVFKIPSQSITGQYNIYVYNTYSSGATSTPSNALNLTIKN